MKKLKISIGLILLLLLSFGMIACFTGKNQLPKEAPLPIVKYGNATIATIESYNNWFDEEKGGNSRLGPPPEESTRDMKPVAVKPNSDLSISFDSGYQPRKIELIHWSQGEIASDIILNDPGFKTAAVPGIYVYEVIGRWDDTHDSAHSFRIEVK